MNKLTKNKPSDRNAGSGNDPRRQYRTNRRRAKSSIFAHGEPMLWFTGGSLLICLVMIVGLMGLILVQGIFTFWPQPIEQFATKNGTVYLGEISRRSNFIDEEAQAGPSEFSESATPPPTQDNPPSLVTAPSLERILIRTGNFKLTSTHFNWVRERDIVKQLKPKEAFIVERIEWGRFYGFPQAMIIDGNTVATGYDKILRFYHQYHDTTRSRWREIHHLERTNVGEINHTIEKARLALRRVELSTGSTTGAIYLKAKEKYDAVKKASDEEYAGIQKRIAELRKENARFVMRFQTLQGKTSDMALADIVRAFPANQITLIDKVGIYFSRWWEFLTNDPREANSEGGIFPAIFGTVLMTLLMTIVVVPFGVLAALYIREYAKKGIAISFIRIAINNLAGVPSIVFGVFGLGFLCYIVGGGIDQIFFPEKLPNPTYGKGGILWAALTLALLTLPVVIVATEEALAAVPGSMREGAYACGASKWQTIHRIILPSALPGIMTGTILAMARGAGEVAPLMLVGAVKLAPELPIDRIFPYLHPERSFMHLGFHIFDLGFQSQNSEAAKPMVYTTTLLLIVIIATLNVTAILIRTRLKRKFVSATF